MPGTTPEAAVLKPSGPARRGPSPAFGALVALLVMAAALTVQLRRQAETLALWDRYTLPGFDARVYMAMADAPGVFTVAPWGYRLLGPALVHVLARPASAEAFLGLSLAALWASGLLLYAWLRALGHARWAAWLGVLGFGLSPPVAVAVAGPFLAEPLLVLLLLALWLALETRAGSGVVALLGAVGLLGKEIFLGFLAAALAFELFRPAAGGRRRALVTTLLAALPAVCMFVVLRRLWTPWLAGAPQPWPGWDVFWLALYRILANAGQWLGPVLLLGLTPLALLGACRRAARPFLQRMGAFLALGFALPFAASVYTDDRRQVPFFADDIPRLLIYALPPLLHLALLALDRLQAEWRPPALLASPPRWPGRLGWALALVLPVLTWQQLDGYRRADLRGPRDGRLVLALARESLAFARRLEAGRPVAYGVAERRFDPDLGHDPRFLERMRWFLRAGWGLRPQYHLGPARMQASEASLLLPCLRPADWTLALRLRSPVAQSLELAVNGRPLGRLDLTPENERYRLGVPQGALFRGDNELRLAAPGPGLELVDLRIQPLATGPS